MTLSDLLSDYIRDFDSDDGWASTDKFERELAGAFEGFPSPVDALFVSILQKYGKGNLEDFLDSYYVRKALKDAPKLVQRTLQLSAIATKITPATDVIFYLREATRCYIYGFWAACVALSRSALEL